MRFAMDSISWIIFVSVPAVIIGVAVWTMRLLNEVHHMQRQQLEVQQRMLAVLERADHSL